MEIADILSQMPPEIAQSLKNGTLKKPSCEEYLALKASWENEEEGRLKGYNCPLCKNRGYSTVVKNGTLYSEECRCMKVRRSIRRIERSGMRDMLDSYTFDSFIPEEPWQAEMKRKAMNFTREDEGKWFAAMGAVGAGKTHICTAICGELLSAGNEVRYMLWRDESVRMKAVVNEKPEYEALVEPLKRAQVLYIDDLFKTKRGENISQADVNLAFELLNYRYCSKKLTTIISSEKTVSEIMDIDEAVGSRIYERSKGYMLKLTGNKNRRLK